MTVGHHVKFIVLLGASVALGGCGEVIFKRGAGPGDMAASQQSCHEKSGGSDASFAACMKDAGFVYSKDTGDGALVGVLKPALPAAAPAVAASTTAEATNTASESTTTAPTAACCAHGTAKVVPSGRGGETIGPGPTPKPAPVDPMAPVAVSSWWKLGGSAGALAAAEDVCIGKLGNAHRPDSNSTKVTAAMLGCLKEAGWYAVGK